LVLVEDLRAERLARYRAEGGPEHDHRQVACDRLHYQFRFGMGPNFQTPTREEIAERIADAIARASR
jgi:hypothetical protein